ncbi:hypothetical protein C900_05723 [Fulvivirga imtechensis AK7]|uniref:Uncharacterized protein n=1 Tax=Fulvivirga imtechensis AK7 TaxID=1237149 RepID=L8JY38_9BACT|nr:hypothetical protein [Fulvivirga imtechensis]ELR73088.1 hypothetical protein C900_05723 [Fulvivirga imtechensis AK7]
MKRIKIFKALLLYLGLLSAGNLLAQELVLQSATAISEPLVVSIDRLNNIYIADKKGNLKQYTHGQLNQVFSPQQTGEITLVEAWNPLKIFLFYADFQEYIFLDRFLTSAQRYSSRDLSSFSGLITISADNNLWVVDYVDFGLRKYNINFRQFTIETPFDLLLDPDNYEITFIREYQNLVFISDKASGILIFDNMGNYLRKIPVKGTDYFTFHKDQLYYLTNNGRELVAQHIYSSQKEVHSLPESALFAVSYDKHIAVITEDSLKIYKKN